MRRSLLLLLAAALVIVRAPLRADDLTLSLFGDYLESLRRQAGIPGLSAAIVGDGDIVWERAFGQQDLEQALATRSDTPFHLDGVTQVFTAELVLRCVEEGRLSVDDRIGRFDNDNPEPDATIRDFLTHTSRGPDGPVFEYRPERLKTLALAVRACTNDSYRETLAKLLARLAMRDSVPGPDSVTIAPHPGVFDRAAVERFTTVLARLATPYAVDAAGRTARSQYTTTTLTASAGLISTTRDLAEFDIALRRGLLLQPETIAASWTPPLSAAGEPLPHGMGWFVQYWKGEPIVWQFGMTENVSSSLIVKVPARGLTLILLANSDGLARPFPLAAGDLTVSPIGRLFVHLFVR